MSIRPPLLSLLVLLGTCLTGLCFGQEVAAEQAAQSTAMVPGSELESMTGPLLRMVGSLAVVLALVGAFAWLARRFRGSQMQGGLIQIVSAFVAGPQRSHRVAAGRAGRSAGRVSVLQECARLHVMDKPTAASGFSLGMADRAAAGVARQAVETAEQD